MEGKGGEEGVRESKEGRDGVIRRKGEIKAGHEGRNGKKE